MPKPTFSVFGAFSVKSGQGGDLGNGGTAVFGKIGKQGWVHVQAA